MASATPNIQYIRDEVRRRRKELKLHPRTVVGRTIRYMYEQGCGEAEIRIVSENWLKRLELGRPASTTANILDALFRALEYTNRERVEWLSRARYSPIVSNVSTTNSVADVINHVMYLVHENPLAAGLIASAIADGRADTLTDDERLEIVAKSLNLVLEHLRRR